MCGMAYIGMRNFSGEGLDLLSPLEGDTIVLFVLLAEKREHVIPMGLRWVQDLRRSTYRIVFKCCSSASLTKFQYNPIEIGIFIFSHIFVKQMTHPRIKSHPHLYL